MVVEKKMGCKALQEKQALAIIEFCLSKGEN